MVITTKYSKAYKTFFQPNRRGAGTFSLLVTVSENSTKMSWDLAEAANRIGAIHSSQISRLFAPLPLPKINWICFCKPIIKCKNISCFYSKDETSCVKFKHFTFGSTQFMEYVQCLE